MSPASRFAPSNQYGVPLQPLHVSSGGQSLKAGQFRGGQPGFFTSQPAMSNFTNASPQMTPVNQAIHPASTKSLVHPQLVTATPHAPTEQTQVLNVNITMNVTGDANFFGAGAQGGLGSFRCSGYDQKTKPTPGRRMRRQRPKSGAFLG